MSNCCMLIVEKNRKLKFYAIHKVSSFMIKNRVDNAYKKGKNKIEKE